jgi:hypothetical protein
VRDPRTSAARRRRGQNTPTLVPQKPEICDNMVAVGNQVIKQATKGQLKIARGVHFVWRPMAVRPFSYEEAVAANRFETVPAPQIRDRSRVVPAHAGWGQFEFRKPRSRLDASGCTHHPAIR